MRNLFLLAALFTLPLMASAANIGIMPVIVRAPESSPNQVLTLSNPGSESVKMQVRVYAWSQEAGKDVLTPTTALIATPGVVNLPAGSKAKVRFRKMGQGGSFRVLITELPHPASTERTAVSFPIEYSLPFLFEATEASSGALSAQGSNGQVVLTNRGGRAVKITRVGPADEAPWKKPLPNAGWILPGSTMDVDAPGQPSRIDVVVDRKPQTLTVQ